MPGRFADTNVLLYLFSGDARRAAIAESLLGEGLTISVQVLNEMASVAVRKQRLDWPAVDNLLNATRRLTTVVPLDLATHDLGLTIASRHRLAIHDSMIVAAALQAECDTLYSEDMHDGLVVDDRLRIVNPFRR